MTEKTYKKLLGSGIAVLIIYIIGSFYINDLEYRRAGLMLNLSLIITIMVFNQFNRYITYTISVLGILCIIFYRDIQVLII